MAEELLSESEIEDRIAVLIHVPLFSQLRYEEQRKLARIAVPKTYPPGRELYHQSDIDSKLYVIQSGRVALYFLNPQGEESLVGQRAGYDPESEEPFLGWLGEASVLLNDAHDVTAAAMTDVRTLEIARAQLFDKELGIHGRLTPQSAENAERVELAARQFKWRDKDEVVMRYVNQHPWSLYRQMIIPVGVLVVLIVIALVLTGLIPALANLSIILVGLIALIPIVIGVIVFIDWRDDYYVVTNKRVLHLDQVPWGKQKREETSLSNIQEVQISRLSAPAQILDFGDLRVETFGGSVSMAYIPHPEELKNLIYREKERVLSRGRALARQSIYKELNNRIGQPDRSTLQQAAPKEKPSQSFSPQLAVRNALRYFFPPAREVEGNRVTYRTHWIALVQRGKFPFAALVFTLIAFVIWWNRGFLIGLLPDAIWFIWPILLIVFGAWSWWVFEDWRNDLYIITDSRIIDIQRTPLLLKETRKEATLDKVQTLETDVPSASARFLRYGTVIIRVPGSSFEFKTVKDPALIQSEVSRKVDQFKRQQAQAAERSRRSELSDWFAVYDQLRQGYKPPGTLPSSSER